MDLAVAFGFVLSVAASILGTHLYKEYRKKRENRPLNQILNFGREDEVIFVFAHRYQEPESVLPRTSTEDFLAINNFISALIKVRWTGKIGVRDTSRLRDEDKKRNIVSICSRKTNHFTGEVEDEIEKRGVSFYRCEQSGKEGVWQITDGEGIFPSKVYGQLSEYLSEGGDIQNTPDLALEDVAVVTKVTNPWNSFNKIFLLHGVRGIGTWGAGECVKKHWQQIYEKLGDKTGDFSALIKVYYKNCDIPDIKVHGIFEIPRARKV